MKNSKKRPISVGMALQGGGAHGAFTWGVLDAFLEAPAVEIEGLSGTSAGAMNAVAFAYGMMEGGRQKAHESLQRFWETMSQRAESLGMMPSYLDILAGNGSVAFTPWFQFLTSAIKTLSPYQWNPHNYNPFEEDLKNLFDLEKLSSYKKTKLFLSATNVRTGKIRIFTGNDLSLKSIMASACLPFLSQAITVEKENYWDGGYIGNPAIFPLIEACHTQDIIIILLMPIQILNTPQTNIDIHYRLNQLSMINGLIREMRAVSFITRLIDTGVADAKKLKHINLHIIHNEPLFQSLHPSSMFNMNAEFIEYLYQEGKKTGQQWIRQNAKYLGVKSTADIEKIFVS